MKDIYDYYNISRSDSALENMKEQLDGLEVDKKYKEYIEKFKEFKDIYKNKDWKRGLKLVNELLPGAIKLQNKIRSLPEDEFENKKTNVRKMISAFVPGSNYIWYKLSKREKKYTAADKMVGRGNFDKGVAIGKMENVVYELTEARKFYSSQI